MLKRWSPALVVIIATTVIAVIIATCSAVRSSSGGGKSGGSSSSAAVPLPVDFPKDFPLYPCAKYLGRDQLVGQVDGRWYDRGWFETHDSGPAVLDWYNAHLSGAGYNPVTNVQSPGETRIGFASDKSAVEMA